MSDYNKKPSCKKSREERALYFLSRAEKIHKDTYDYSEVLNTFVTQREPVKIICKKCGPFFQLPANHLKGKGCKKCAKQKINAVRYKKEYELAKENKKICSSCHKIKLFSCFPPEPNGRKIGKVSAWCKECYTQKNETIYKQRIRHYNLKKYGIDNDGYLALLEKQNFKCKICGISAENAPPVGSSKGGQLCVDHNHLTNKIRGLLCSRCNTGLGLFMDDIENLESAILYLQETNTQQI